MTSQHTIAVNLVGADVIVKPAGYMPGDAFGEYLEACRAATCEYRPELRAQLTTVENLPEVIMALRSKGFEISVQDELTELLRARAEVDASAFENRMKRIAGIEAELATRDLTLYPYQRVGVSWLMDLKSAGLFDEMGLGKTPQALVALDQDASKVAAIVVAPASVKSVWRDEMAKFRPDLRPTVLKGRKSFRWPNKGEVVIINYDILPDITEERVADPSCDKCSGSGKVLASSWNPNGVTVSCKCVKTVVRMPEVPDLPIPGTYLIADEAHLLKGASTKRAKRFRQVADRIRTVDGRVWGLTGSPLMNRPRELWNVLKAFNLAEKAFGTFSKFNRMFTGSKEVGLPELLKKVSLRRHRIDVLPDLPTKTHKIIQVNNLSASVRKMADQLVDHLKEQGIDLEKIKDADQLAKIQSLAFTMISKLRAALATAKIPALIEQIEAYEDANEPLVVFSSHREPIDTLGHRAGWETITGSTSQDRRAEIVKDFQAGKLKGLGLTTKAGGTGITLTAAHHALFVDLEWSPVINAQAEDRICRIGQDKGCVITWLVASHLIEERVAELLAEKQQIIDASVNASARTEVEEEVPASVKAAQETFKVHSAGSDPARKDAGKKATTITVRTVALQDGQTFTIPAPERSEWNGKVKRGPENKIEEHAAAGLLQLASDDPDYAGERNGIGFSGYDGEFGHSLADQIKSYGRLSDKQWAAAIKMVRKYRRQVGLPE